MRERFDRRKTWALAYHRCCRQLRGLSQFFKIERHSPYKIGGNR